MESIHFHLELLFYETIKETTTQMPDPIYQIPVADPLSTEIRQYRKDLLGSNFQLDGSRVGIINKKFRI